MRLLTRRVSAVALWFSAGMVLSACAVLTNPTVTPETSTRSPLPTPIAQSTLTSPLATPLPFALVSQVIDLAFVDPQHGWFLASVCQEDHTCPLVVHATSDGGQTWQAVNAPAAEPIYSENNLSDTKHVDALRFANASVGWAFSPDLFSTRNGGKTWRDEKRVVVALELIGSSVWAIQLDDNQSIVVASNDLGQTWQVIGSLPAQYSRLSLVRADLQTAWILTWKEVTREAQLFMTQDGGRSWQLQSLPAYAGRYTSLILARSSDKKLWLLCGGGLATAMQLKSLYASTDNGASWDLVADNNPTEESKSRGRIPASGHMWDSRGFAVTSPTTAFMALNRGTLYVTHDGGQNWDDVSADQPINEGDAQIGPLRFIDMAHGWLVSAGRIFRTVDGGVTWRTFPIQ